MIDFTCSPVKVSSKLLLDPLVQHDIYHGMNITQQTINDWNYYTTLEALKKGVFTSDWTINDIVEEYCVHDGVKYNFVLAYDFKKCSGEIGYIFLEKDGEYFCVHNCC